MWWIPQWPLEILTMGFGWKIASKPKAEEATHLWLWYLLYKSLICYFWDDLRSDPAKGFRWRSQLSGTLLQLDRKPHRKVSTLHPVMTFYQFLHIHLRHTIQAAECFILDSEMCNPARGAAQQMLQEVPAHEPWLKRAWQFCSRVGMTHRPTLSHFGGNPTQTNAEQPSAEGRRARCVCSDLKPPMCLSLGCSWTIAFLWSSCISQRLFCLFS